MILITGATGRIGHHLTDELIKRGEDVRVLVKNKQKIIDKMQVLPENLDIVEGDITNKDSLHPNHSDHSFSNCFTLLPAVNLSEVRTNFASFSLSPTEIVFFINGQLYADIITPILIEPLNSMLQSIFKRCFCFPSKRIHFISIKCPTWSTIWF